MFRKAVVYTGTVWYSVSYMHHVKQSDRKKGVFGTEHVRTYNRVPVRTTVSLNMNLRFRKKVAASSMLHEAKIAYYAFDVIVYCMYTHQTRIAYKKRTH